MMNKGRNDNHPKKGASIKVQPTRDLESIQSIKQNLANQPRNLCLFTMGINTAYRANELLSITVGQVAHLQAGDILDIKQSKTNEYRSTVLNAVTVEALQSWLSVHPKAKNPQAPLFISEDSKGKALLVSSLIHLVKLWCAEAGLQGNYGSHTLRKTWGYHQRITNNAPIALIMQAFAHTSETQTLKYLCILPNEVHDLYRTMEL